MVILKPSLEFICTSLESFMAKSGISEEVFEKALGITFSDWDLGIDDIKIDIESAIRNILASDKYTWTLDWVAPDDDSKIVYMIKRY